MQNTQTFNSIILFSKKDIQIRFLKALLIMREHAQTMK